MRVISIKPQTFGYFAWIDPEDGSDTLRHVCYNERRGEWHIIREIPAPTNPNRLSSQIPRREPNDH